MKRLLLICLICLLPVLAWAGSNPYVLGQYVAAGGSGAWYYSGDGNLSASNYEGTDSASNGYMVGFKFTTLSGKSLTKISFYVNTTGSCDDFKIALYDASGNLQRNDTIPVASITAPGWNDATVAAYSITGDIYVVASANNNLSTVTDASAVGQYLTAAYGDQPPASCTFTEYGSFNWAVRVYAQ